MIYLKRKIDLFLTEWKNTPDKKPLIVKGARQIGKTESVCRFGNLNYENVININFVEEPKYKMIISDSYFKGALGALVRVICFLVVLVTVGGRLWCGVHWFTDIVGGILLSLTMLLLFSAAVSGGRDRNSTLPQDYKGYKPKH